MRRRFGVSLLLVVLLAPMLSVWFLADGAAEASLPACCRTHGKHQCSLGFGTSSEHTALTHPLVSERCPMQGAAPAAHPLDQRGVETSVPVIFRVERTDLAGTRVRVRYRTFHAHPKRGPPSSSVCSHEA